MTERVEPIRPIRALLRGLEALASINRGEGLTVTEVAENARLPRTTAYRILETLRVGGFVTRDEADDRYRPTLAVKGLASGAEDDAWVRETLWPSLTALGKKILWPVGFYTPRGGQMVMRAGTDRTSPLALERYAPGHKLALTKSAPGAAYLSALGPDAARRLLAAAGAAASAVEAAVTAASEARNLGVALDHVPVAGECTAAVPVIGPSGEPVGALTLRYIRSALSSQRVIAELAPQLRAIAAELSAPPAPQASVRTDDYRFRPSANGAGAHASAP